MEQVHNIGKKNAILQTAVIGSIVALIVGFVGLLAFQLSIKADLKSVLTRNHDDLKADFKELKADFKELSGTFSNIITFSIAGSTVAAGIMIGRFTAAYVACPRDIFSSNNNK